MMHEAASARVPCGTADVIPASLAEEVRLGIERWSDGLSEPPPAEQRAQAARLFAASPWIAEQAGRAPDAFLALLRTIEATPDDRPPFAGAEAPLTGPALAAALRRYRNDRQVHILARELLGLAGEAETLTRLTRVADACITHALAGATAEVVASAGILPGETPGAPAQLIVIAMGKLGAGELNLSSDIDLIFVHPDSDATSGGRRRLSPTEWFERVGRATVKLLAERTADGFCYRVDLRLRPFGNSGPPVISLAGLEHYLLVHGRDWERYAMIKARAIGGETDARRQLAALIRPFVYRRYLDYGAIGALREMKAMIAREVARAGLSHDVKRGAGGIREVEFIGQVFQLMRGGRDPSLRVRPIMQVVATLAEQGLLDAAEADALVRGYWVLRRVENRLQGMRDEQTHTLPDTPVEWDRLAFACGADSPEAIAETVAAARAGVADVFAKLLHEDGDDGTTPDPASALRLDELFDNEADDDVAAALMALGFRDAEAARAILVREVPPTLLARLSSEARSRLDALLPRLLAAAATVEDPATVLTRLVRLLVAIARRSVYLSALTEYPSALERLVMLFDASPWVAEEITRHPILLDELLDPRRLYAARLREELDRTIAADLGRVPPDDVEQRMETLRWFRHREVLHVAASDITGQIPVNRVSDYLTDIAESVVEQALALAWDMLVAKHGQPLVAGRRIEVIVVAYGKLGGIELGYGSDLDLVFVHDDFAGSLVTDGPRPLDAGAFFARLAQRFIHLLSTPTPAGRAYEIDTRLRPSGNSGLMVVSQSAFARYQANEAWTWEHQALVRARAVAGPAASREAFGRLREAVLTRPRDLAQLRDDVLAMRAKMRAALDRSDAAGFDLKQGVGGITDLEFVVQYAVLAQAARHPELVRYTDNWRLIEALRDGSALAPDTADALVNAYFALRAESHRQALYGRSALVDKDAYAGERAAIRAAWRDTFGVDAGTETEHTLAGR